MLKHEDHIFTNLNGYNSFKLNDAKSRGCWDNTKKYIQRGSKWIINEIRLSDLRGRGGAGFPTGLRWSFIPEKSKLPKYLIVNADESEPGTCKDRDIIRHEPHKLIEGSLLSAFAIGAHVCYVYIHSINISRQMLVAGGSDHEIVSKTAWCDFSLMHNSQPRFE